jgi:mono/diheme cytochrome c family protein
MEVPMNARISHHSLAVRLAHTICLAGMLAGMCFAPAAAAEDRPETRAEWGRIHYRVHCLNCHGTDGKGGGPVAEVLTLEPTDLTLIAERHGGEFPADEVYEVIDGRNEVASHGRRDMPVWGLSFQERGRDNDQQDEVHQKILDLVEYLRSIQVATDP